MSKPIKSIGQRNSKFKILEERNLPVTKANVLIQKTRYNLTANEQKLVLHFIQKIRLKDKKIEPITFAIKDYCELYGLDPDSGANYQSVRRTLKSLADKSFWITEPVRDKDGNVIPGEEEEKLCRWLSEVTAHRGKGTFTVELDKKLTPYLVNLKKFFTTFNYYYVMTMRSQYSIRLYQLLKSHQDEKAKDKDYEIEFSLDHLRTAWEIDKKKYKEWQDFKRNVIDKAVKEVNKLTDVFVDYDVIKEGKPVVGVRLKVEEKSPTFQKMSFKAVEERLDPNSKQRKRKKRVEKNDELPF